MVATMAAACSGSQKRGARPARAFSAEHLTAADVVPRHSWCALHVTAAGLPHMTGVIKGPVRGDAAMAQDGAVGDSRCTPHMQ